MRKIPIAIASSDWHFHKFNAFNENNRRLRETAKAARMILQISTNLGIPHLFCGDMVHNPLAIDNDVAHELIETLLITKANTLCISGNHDMPDKNSFNGESMSYMKTLGLLGLTEMVWKDGLLEETILIYGFDYHDSDVHLLDSIKDYENTSEFKKDRRRKILMLHSDCPGAKTPAGIEIGEAKHFPRHLDKLFSNWDLVLFGHIHKPQKLSKKCYMLGSPIQQTIGDIGTEMGYWTIYNDLSIEFKCLNHIFPTFKLLGRGEQPNNKRDYFIPYETPIEEIAELKNDSQEFNMSLSRKKLAQKYCRIKGIKDKGRITELINTLTSIE